MDNKDIFSIIFDKIEDDELFDFNDLEKDELDKKVTIADDRVNNYLKRKFHPKEKRKIQRLIVDYSNAMCCYYRKENELFFKNGIAFGVKFIMQALSMKM